MNRKTAPKSKESAPSSASLALETIPARRHIASRIAERSNAPEQTSRVQHKYYVPNFESKRKSSANALVKEFLSRVFASDGASRFFKTFLLRFLFDGGSKSSDDCSGTLAFAPAF